MRRAVIIYVGCPEDEKVANYLREWNLEVESDNLVLDFQSIKEKLFELVEDEAELLFIIGGIGLTKEDVVPEAVLSIVDRRLHGLESILLNDDDPRIPILRSIAGVRRKTLVITLPSNYEIMKKMLDRTKESILKALEVLEKNEKPC